MKKSVNCQVEGGAVDVVRWFIFPSSFSSSSSPSSPSSPSPPRCEKVQRWAMNGQPPRQVESIESIQCSISFLSFFSLHLSLSLSLLFHINRINQIQKAKKRLKTTHSHRFIYIEDSLKAANRFRLNSFQLLHTSVPSARRLVAGCGLRCLISLMPRIFKMKKKSSVS